MGVNWFGDGSAPARVLIDGQEASRHDAVAAGAQVLAAARRVGVLVGPDLSCQAQREAVALADLCRAFVDTVASGAARATTLSSQAMGRATTTLGELRNRADVLVFWDTDGSRHPRFAERYAPDPPGLYVAKGRGGRVVVTVAVHQPAWPGADVVVRIRPEEELAALAALDALARDPDASIGLEPQFAGARQLARIITVGRYVGLVFDGDADASHASAARADALWRLSQALNHRTRGAALALRGGGNRSGAEAVLTAATGYPFAVDFSRGSPRYRPHDSTFSGASSPPGQGAFDVAVLLGDTRDVGEAVTSAGDTTIAIGPQVSQGPFARGRVVIDTARAGVHEGGTALRMDDVPLPLRAVLPGPGAAVEAITELVEAVRREQAANRPSRRGAGVSA
jgi:formylmethanofuran dehydrogenase subunit B